MLNERLKVVISRLKQLANLGTVVAVALLISLLYPNNVKFKYEFQRGQIWKYDDLVAPFDFAIRKTNEELQADKDLIMKEFWPYYALNESLANAKLKDFEAEYDAWADEQTADIPSKLQLQKIKENCLSFLDKLYAKGIVQLNLAHLTSDEKFVIHVVRGNTSFKRTPSSFVGLEAAKTQVEEFGNDPKNKIPPAVILQLKDALVPNITYDETRTNAMLEDAISNISPSRGLVAQGETIVLRGNVVTDEVYEKLTSYKAKFESDISSKKSGWVVYIGYLLLTGLILGAFIMYINSYRKEILKNWNYLAFIMIWMIAFSYLTYLVERTEVLSVYVIPFCVVPIVVRHFFTYRLAFFTHVVVVLIAGFLTAEGHQFLFTQIVAGVVAVLAVADARDWSRFFRSVVAIFSAYLLSQIGMSLIEEGSFRSVDWQSMGWLAFNGLLTLLAFPLIPLTERMFGFTSSISLVELSDVNRPLLRELAMKAPGTFQHSLQVGNLAEAAANEIGADPLLVRVGALYHDIGKTLQPEYFVENQSGYNPHEGMPRTESARIIIEHVTEGEKMAKKQRLPQSIQRFITTHHGTTRTEYFYKTYVAENPNLEVDIGQFTYPGPLPKSKEEAILMLADSVEATSRSLKSPTGQDIDNLVDKIFKGKIEQGQLNESKLTFGELVMCKAVFQKMLRSIHHVRIEYPE